VPLSKDMASILLCGILSDTLTLRSATTTDADREQAEYLANVADLDVAALGQDIIASAAKAGRMPVADIVRLDMKEYTSSGRSFSVSQVEISGPEGMESKADAILGELKALRSGNKSLFAALMVTDVIELSSTLYVDADRDFLAMIAYPRLAQGVYELKGVLSRKKQLMPELFDLVEKLGGK
jgi:manganese-dependent inorganic pyrophosphatase